MKPSLSPMYRPLTGGMSSDNLREAIISSSSSCLLIKGKYPPVDLHILEASVHDLIIYAFDCRLGHLLFFGMVNPTDAQHS